MNTSPTTNQKTPAPFAAQIHFKPQHLWQGKYKKWTFRSDEYSEFQAPAHQQWYNLERMTLSDLRGTYFLASIFDNRLHNYKPMPNGLLDQGKKNNLVLQNVNGIIKIDKRKELDLSWLEPSFDKHYLKFLADSFAEAKWLTDFQVSHLSETIREYKQSVYGITT